MDIKRNQSNSNNHVFGKSNLPKKSASLPYKPVVIAGDIKKPVSLPGSAVATLGNFQKELVGSPVSPAVIGRNFPKKPERLPANALENTYNFQKEPDIEVKGAIQSSNEEAKGNMSRRNGFLFVLSLFLALAGFTALIAWVVFKSPEGNELEKKLSAGATDVLSDSSSRTAKTPAKSAAPKQVAPAPAPAPQTESAASSSTTAPVDAGTSPDSGSDQTGIFRDDKLGISLSNPEDYKIIKNNNQITVSKSGILWKLKIYDNKDKKELKPWFDAYYSSSDNTDCQVSDSNTLKIGTLTTKLIKASSDDGNCDDAGYYALSNDSLKAVRIILEKGTEEDANKISSTFKFL